MIGMKPGTATQILKNSPKAFRIYCFALALNLSVGYMIRHGTFLDITISTTLETSNLIKLSLNKSPATLLKKMLCHGCFPGNFAKNFENTFFTEHLCWSSAALFTKKAVLPLHFVAHSKINSTISSECQKWVPNCFFRSSNLENTKDKLLPQKILQNKLQTLRLCCS